MSLAVSPAPLQNGHTEINGEMDGGKVTGILKGQNGKAGYKGVKKAGRQISKPVLQSKKSQGFDPPTRIWKD